VIDPRWVKPLPKSLVTMAQRYSCVVVVEDGITHAGIGSAIAELLQEHGVRIPIHSIGVPLEFIEHSKRDEILHDLGIDVQSITRNLVSWSIAAQGLDSASVNQSEEAKDISRTKQK